MSWLQRLFKGKKTEDKITPIKEISKTTTIVAPVQGELMNLADVDDPVFAQKMLGDGFAIMPQGSKLVAPIDGVVITVMATRHAFAFKADNGLEVLVHLGIDTVELNGRPFTLNISDGRHVKAGQEIGLMDLEQVKKAGKDPSIMVIVTNMDKVDHFEKFELKKVNAGQQVLQVIAK